MSSPYTIANYNISDMFFNNPDYCIKLPAGGYSVPVKSGARASNTKEKGDDTAIDCKKNYAASKKMQALQNQISASKEKIDNVQLLYSRELIYTINLTAGIGGLILYLYYNK